MSDQPIKDGHNEPEKDTTAEVPPQPNGQQPKAPGRFDKTFETDEKAVHALVDMSLIQLKAEDLYDKDKVDLEQVELDDVWTLLQLVFLPYLRQPLVISANIVISA